MPLYPNSLVRYVPANRENFEHEEKVPEVTTFLQLPGIGTNGSGGAICDLATAHPISQLLGLSIGLVKKCIPHWSRVLVKQDSRPDTKCARQHQGIPEADVPPPCLDLANTEMECGRKTVYTPSKVSMELR
jgi:hypothetical protein